jgi:copper chaperone CopZ
VSRFIVAYDIDLQNEVISALKAVPGVVVTGKPLADGTVTVKTTTRTLDDEAAAVHAMEDVHGVIDVRLLEK